MIALTQHIMQKCSRMTNLVWFGFFCSFCLKEILTVTLICSDCAKYHSNDEQDFQAALKFYSAFKFCN